MLLKSSKTDLNNNKYNNINNNNNNNNNYINNNNNNNSSSNNNLMVIRNNIRKPSRKIFEAYKLGENSVPSHLVIKENSIS